MSRGSHASINRKFTLLILGALLLILVLTTIAFGYSAYRDTNARLEASMHPLSRLLATQAGASLLFEEPATLERDLQSLSSVQGIVSAKVFDKSGNVFASYQRDTREPAPPLPNVTGISTGPTGFLKIIDSTAHYIYPIAQNGETLGYIELIDDMTAINAQILRTLALGLCIFLIAIMLAIPLAGYVSAIVTRPVHQLRNTLSTIVREDNYALRAPKRANDEIGELVDSFNYMLDELNHRDAKLAAYSQGLEALVAQRTKELDDATQKAQSANEAKTRFLANISHEVRTPLSAIVGLSQLLRNTAISEQQSIYLLQQEQASRHLLRMIDDLLDVALLQSGRSKLSVVPFNMVDLIASLRAILDIRAHEKQLELQLDCPTSLPETLYGDRRKLTQVLLNLLDNSIKFTEQGSVRLTVRQVSRGAEVITLGFSVKDTGIGIEPKDIGSLFRPFSQLAPTHQTNQGMGLGLAISQEMVEAMGGQIEARSELGVGSEFSFSVRLHIAQQQGKITEAPSGEMQPQLNRILLVEDSPLVSNVETALLETLCDHVVTAASIEEARAKVREHDFDAILLDIRLPDGNGVDFCRELRALPATASVPVFALTAHALISERQRCFDAGMDAVWSKPLDLETLRLTFEKFYNKACSITSPLPKKTELPPIAQTASIWQRLDSLKTTLGEAGLKVIINEVLEYLPLLDANICDAAQRNDNQALRAHVHDYWAPPSSGGIAI